jgi:hypothetical protein
VKPEPFNQAAGGVTPPFSKGDTVMANEIETRSFALGRVVITRNALQSLNESDVQIALGRHVHCDWGDCPPDDAAANEAALGEELRIFSVYSDRNGTTFWIITEADRSATTVLLPEDY